MKICIQSSAQLASATCAHNIPGGNSKAHTLALFCLSSWKTPTANCAHAGHSENGVVQCLPCKGPRSTVEMYSKRKTIARCPCTPPLTLETFGEKISAKACSEGLFRLGDSGFKEEEYDDTKIVKSRRSGFSRPKLEAGMNGLSLYIYSQRWARELLLMCFEGLANYPRRV